MSELHKPSQTEVDARFKDIVSGLYNVSLKHPDESATEFGAQSVAYDVWASRAKNLISYRGTEPLRNRIDFIVNLAFNRIRNSRNPYEDLIPAIEVEIKKLMKLNGIEFHETVKAVGLLKIVNQVDGSSRDFSLDGNGVFGRIDGVKVYRDGDSFYRAGFAIKNAVVDNGKNIAEFPVDDEVIVVPVELSSGAMLYKLVGPDDDPLR